ncbi:hypothetical protein NIA71_08610 [Ihubacter massiliensis]|uniref:hypothetical protein n=1 Tax=Ihubacter massiliensis TaxID=1852367 RepID=UPI0011DE10D5|nr:hypothetical protein [Ihubacter massiliensis]MCO7121897.1 hypothetical protein [Ihubacter massiliensis]MCO7122008.1 hypothetical protein [Ihubacter massiliensis]
MKTLNFTDDELMTIWGMALADKHNSYEMAQDARERGDQKQEQMYLADAERYENIADKIARAGA